MIKTVVAAILIIAVVGFCVYGFLAERTEKAEAEFSGTATYSGTWSTSAPYTDTNPFGNPKWNGTCELTVDFDAWRASISFAGDLSGTFRVWGRKEPTGGYRFNIFIEGSETGRIRGLPVTEKIKEYSWLVVGRIYADHHNAAGHWTINDKHRRVFITGWWQAQKVPTP